MIFALHPADEKRAIVMMREAFDAGVSIIDLLSEICDYLISQKAEQTHIEKQLERVRALRLGKAELQRK